MSTEFHTAGRGPAAPRIAMQDALKVRGQRTIWSGVSFEVGAGRSLALVGPSGSGKSTLLHCIGLLERLDGGSLHIDGVDLTRISAGRRRRLFRRGVAHVFQNFGLVPEWSVDRNLDLAFIGQGRSRHGRSAARTEALRSVHLEDVGRVATSRLSGGEQQRVALARLLLKEPSVVVADEPSAALDDANVEVALATLAILRDLGAAVVVATHDRTVADWSDQQLDLADYPAPTGRASPAGSRSR